jgi:hypothetical protein
MISVKDRPAAKIASLEKERSLDALYIDRLESFKKKMMEIEEHCSSTNHCICLDSIGAKIRDALDKSGLR